MKDDTANNNNKERIVIPDECGDTMWDEVLNQEITACQANNAINGATTVEKKDKNETTVNEITEVK